jgi:hypothetical protein
LLAEILNFQGTNPVSGMGSFSNFNNGSQDIGSRAKDRENGRFEELGWARSFETYGYVHMDVTWKNRTAKIKIKVYKGSSN